MPAIQIGSTMFGPDDTGSASSAVNLWGVIHGSQIFVPGMIERGRPGLVINTGSKQGITTPPGDPAYNVSKAGVKAFTEALQHELRNTAGAQITAHLLIPGFVFTSLTANGRTEKPAAAWTPEQTVDFMMERLDAGDFYILCPDNDVPRSLDEKRIAWAAGDIIENRPPLSRWHPDYAEKFAAYLKDVVAPGQIPELRGGRARKLSEGPRELVPAHAAIGSSVTRTSGQTLRAMSHEMAVMGEIDHLAHLGHLGEEAERLLGAEIVEGLHDVVGHEGHRLA